jgi:hypothetical protein
MFYVIKNNKKSKGFKSFKQVFEVFWNDVNKQIGPKIPWSVLEKTTLLVLSEGKEEVKMNYGGARDLGYECGLVHDGSFQPFTSEPPLRAVRIGFKRFSIENLKKRERVIEP